VRPETHELPEAENEVAAFKIETGTRRWQQMRYRFRLIRTQTTERTIRASDEEAAMRKLRDELARPYGFLGRWEDAALDIALLQVESSIEAHGGSVEGGPRLLSVRDAAAHLGISRGLMYDLLNRGEIASVRIGQRRLVSREAINQFIEAHSGTG
jgi:excisionase family DNA binding protein